MTMSPFCIIEEASYWLLLRVRLLFAPFYTLIKISAIPKVIRDVRTVIRWASEIQVTPIVARKRSPPGGIKRLFLRDGFLEKETRLRVASSASAQSYAHSSPFAPEDLSPRA